MSTAVVVGLLHAVGPGRITLSGNLHIIVPPELVVPAIPLQSSVTIVVHEQNDGQLIADSIQRSKGDGRLFA